MIITADVALVPFEMSRGMASVTRWAFKIGAPEADVTAPASGKTVLSFFLEQNPYYERLAIRSRRRCNIPDCLLAVVDQNEDFGADITRKRVVIGAVTLFLQDDKRIGKRDNTAREAAACRRFAGVFRNAMLEGPINLRPCRFTARFARTHEQIGAIARKRMKQRIVSCADAAFQVGLAWTLRAGLGKPPSSGD